MIGELIVSITDEDSGLRCYLGSCYRVGGGADPVVGFNLANPAVIASIRERRSDILCILAELIDKAALVLDIPTVEHAMGLGWEYHKQGGAHCLEEYQSRLHWALENPFIDEQFKDRARVELQSIEQATTTTKAKRRLTKRRRSDFQKERDRLMLAIIERDGYLCDECGGTESLTIDHIMPLSKGGSDELDNLRLLCQSCNSTKGDRMPEG